MKIYELWLQNPCKYNPSISEQRPPWLYSRTVARVFRRLQRIPLHVHQYRLSGVTILSLYRMEKRSAGVLHAPKDNAEILLTAPRRVVAFHVQVNRMNHPCDSLPRFIFNFTSCMWFNVICAWYVLVLISWKTCWTENLLFLDLTSANLFNYYIYKEKFSLQ